MPYVIRIPTITPDNRILHIRGVTMLHAGISYARPILPNVTIHVNRACAPTDIFFDHEGADSFAGRREGCRDRNRSRGRFVVGGTRGTRRNLRSPRTPAYQAFLADTFKWKCPSP